MKRIFNIAATLAMALLATSCVNDLFDEAKPSSTEVRLWGGIATSKVSRTDVAVDSEAEAATRSQLQYTRAAINSNLGIRIPSYGGTLDIGMARVSKKEEADRFPDFRALNKPILARLGNSDGTSGNLRPIEFLSQAQFFPDATSELRYVAWYPWTDTDANPNDADDGSTYFSDDKATYVTSDITGSKDVMYGNMIEGSLIAGFPVMEFDHALCVFRVHVYAMIAYDEFGNEIPVADWGKIEEITLNNVPQQVQMTLPHLCIEVVDGKPVHNGETADEFVLNFLGVQELPLHNNPAIPFDPPTALPLGINKSVMVSEAIAGPPADGILRLSVKTSTQTAHQEVSIARNFRPGHAYDIVLRFSDHGMINSEVLVSDWVVDTPINENMAANMYYDLCGTETSNCYIIRSANYSYSFDGNVKGNGNGALLGMSEADTKLNTGWVEELWNDLPTDLDLNGDGVTGDAIFKLQSNLLTENKVLFDINGYTTTVGDEVNKDNKVLPARGNVLVGGYDKNPAEGGKLLWTWHLWITPQPTPIGCSNGFVVLDRNLGATTAEPTVGGVNDPAHGFFYQWGRPTPLRKEGLTTSSAKVRLDNLYPDGDPNVLYGEGDVEGAWIDESGPWGSAHDHMWGDTGDNYEDPQKTIFDPCPPGYFVSNYAFWRDFEEYEVNQAGYSFSEKGVAVNRQSENIWLPATDVLDDSGVEDASFVGVTMRTSSIDYQNGTSPYNFYYTASKTAERSSDKSWCNYAIPVRCIATTTAPTVVDLSESQTANCYIVTEPGYYKFKATVRGNGVYELWPFGSSTNKQMLDFSDGMSATIAPALVDFLWWQGDFTEMAAHIDGGGTNNNMVEKLQCIEILNDGKLKDGYLEFVIREGNFHPGNAILAAYDASGKILWTWHIWMPSTRPEDRGSGRRTMMDRYLGATQAPVIGATTADFDFVDYKGNVSTSMEAVWATFGFYYQWGRKDPIMQTDVDTNGSGTAAANLPSAPYWRKAFSLDGSGAWSYNTTINRQQGPTKITNTVENPLMFVYTSAGQGSTQSRWYNQFSLSETNAAMWGYAVMGTGKGEDFSKTFYDPCPPGYRTPFHEVWLENPESTSSDGYGGADNRADTVFDWTTEGSYTGYGFVTIKNSFDDNFYPYAGRRNYTGAHQNVQTYGYMTSGMPYGTYNTRTFSYEKANTQSRQITGEGVSYGRSLRCMKE
ncbi:MAG: fimbrillin family protein [Tidjanibacter sp.]|nr:fimbrillin family protein [Tidjanibacter sp.]